MIHQATVEELSRFLDGDLPEGDEKRIKVLLEQDEEARRVFEGLQKVRGGLAQLDMPAPPRHLSLVLEQRLTLEAENVGVWDRVDRRLRSLAVGGSFLSTFCIVAALAVMAYMLSLGLSRFDAERGPVFMAAPPSPVEAPLIEPESVSLAGRSFQRLDGIWVEARLLKAGTHQELLAGGALPITGEKLSAWLDRNPGFDELETLGSLQLLMDDELVWLDFESVSP